MEFNDENERLAHYREQLADIRKKMSQTRKYEIVTEDLKYNIYEVKYSPNGEKVSVLKKSVKRNKKSMAKIEDAPEILPKDKYKRIMQIMKGADEEETDSADENPTSNDEEELEKVLGDYGTEHYKEFQEMLGSTKAFTDMMKVWHKYKNPTPKVRASQTLEEKMAKKQENTAEENDE